MLHREDAGRILHCLWNGAVEKARIVGAVPCACHLDRDKHRAPTRGAPTILYFLWFFNNPGTQALRGF
ncbi:hypothetical protein KKB99_03565, partial [bacterium]|nr:hypothetical protein [bacterium]MBU1025069.1 hypothetical protein [bacterium]